jgi:HEAT repeat protein
MISLADLQLLIARLGQGSEDERAAAVYALVEHGEPAAVALAPALALRDAETRWWVVAALAQLPGPTATQALVKAMADPDESIRAVAAQALGARQEGTSALIAALDDANTFVSLQAASALTRLGPEAVPALVNALRTGLPRVRVGAARALAAIQSRDSVPALVAALQDDSPAVHFYAEQGLQRMGVGALLIKPQ